MIGRITAATRRGQVPGDAVDQFVLIDPPVLADGEHASLLTPVGHPKGCGGLIAFPGQFHAAGTQHPLEGVAEFTAGVHAQGLQVGGYVVTAAKLEAAGHQQRREQRDNGQTQRAASAPAHGGRFRQRRH